MRWRVASAGLCLAGFVLASIGVGSKRGLSSLDRDVWQFMVDHTGSTQRAVARAITSWGVAGVLLPAAVVVAVVAWWRLRSLVAASVPVIVVQATSLIVREAKGHFMVPRPSTAPVMLAAHNPAFPSGHTANTIAFLITATSVVWCITKSRPARVATLAVASAGSLAMGWTRLALGVHWFSDVVGGLLLGGAIGLTGAAALAHVTRDSTHDAATS